MNKVILYSTFIAIFTYISAAGLLYLFQRSFLYFPSPQYEHPFERFGISSQGETIEVVVLNKGHNKALIYFGGNGEAVVANAENFASNFSNVTIYLVNYRGYGGSSGEPTEAGNYTDSLSVYDEIKERHSHISVAGRSLGSGVATYLAANRSIEKVVLITPYDSVLSVAKKRFPIFPVKFLLKDHYDSLSRAKQIKSNVLVVVAEHDQVIPMQHTQKLIDVFDSEQLTLKIIKKEGHNSLSNNADYYSVLSDFI